MSRTSRHRTEPELVRGEPAVEMAEEDRPTVHRLTGELHDAFEAILSPRLRLGGFASPEQRGA